MFNDLGVYIVEKMLLNAFHELGEQVLELSNMNNEKLLNLSYTFYDIISYGEVHKTLQNGSLKEE